MAHQPTLQRVLDKARQMSRSGNCVGQDARDLSLLLESVPIEELGYSSKAVLDPASALGKSSKAISYQHIFEDEEVAMGIFCFSARATIPLHNHPNMTVWSRLLFGDLHVRAFDFADGQQQQLHHHGSHDVPAKLVRNRVLKAPCDSLTLFPASGGNIHAFEAMTPCAVLDVLIPPYDVGGGRPCTYYGETTLADDAPEGSLCHLKEVEAPEEFVVSRRTYRGVTVC